MFRCVPFSPLRLIYLKGRNIGREGERKREKKSEKELSHLLVRSPNGPSDQAWATPKRGARSFYRVFLVGTEPQNLDHLILFLGCISRQRDRKWSNWNTNLPRQCHRQGFPRCATAPATTECLLIQRAFLDISLRRKATCLYLEIATHLQDCLSACKPWRAAQSLAFLTWILSSFVAEVPEPVSTSQVPT